MSIIASTFNTGTGLSSAVTNEGTLPIVIDDLTVNGNLTVIEATVLNGETTITSNLTVGQTTTTNNAIINNNIILNNGVGQNNTALFKLPLASGTNNQVLTITDQTLVPITTAWQSPTVISNYVQYDTAQTKLKNNISGVVSDIDKIVINGSIGKTATQDFVLPSNTSTSGNGFKLTITDQTTTPMTTAWTSQYYANDFLRSNPETFRIYSVIDQVETLVYKLTLDGTIGKIDEGFQLPNNTSLSSDGYILSILNETTKTTHWVAPPPSITDYMQYNTTSFNMSTNVSGTPTIITDIVVSNTIGAAKMQAFKLPANTTTASNGDVLRILNNASVPITTEWADTSTVLPDYVSYNPTTTQLTNNPLFGGPSVITDIAVTKIGSTNAQLFSLPNNTSTTANGQILSILDATTKTTQWITPPPTITDYVSFDVGTAKLKNNNLGVANIDYLDLQQIKVNVIGKPNDLFALPSNTTSAGNANTVLKIIDATTKETSWEPLTTTTQTVSLFALATSTSSTVEMCRASNLVAGTYIMTYQVEPEITTTTRAFAYRSYGVSTSATSLTSGGVVGLTYCDSVPYTAPVMTATSPLRYSGSGVVVLTATTTLYLIVRFVYTGTTFNTKGTLKATRIA
jgi:hypothetical protein